jgi:hypothetical protein
MKIVIQGQDYSAALDGAQPLKIERKLNEPSVCQFALSLQAGGPLVAPARFESLAVTGDDDTVYFTGYVVGTPMPEFAGLALDGPRYRFAVLAASDEMLLDQALMAPSKGMNGLNAGPLFSALVAHTGSSAITTSALTLSSPVAHFVPEPGAPFSKSAGMVAAQARAAYRAVNGALTLAAIPSAIHTLNEEDGSLTLANLTLNAGMRRSLANDITVCGEHEPAAYVTEYFLGDGVTTQFNLAAEPFFNPASKTNLIAELFNEPIINVALWSAPAGANYFSLGAGGLMMTGGSGIDGQTQMTWIDPIEMGGTLLLETEGLTLANASTGILCGFFTGVQTISDCVAGFQATAQQGTGNVSLQPIVAGAASGTVFNLNAANQYTLRLRAHCPEMQRQLATYFASGDNGAISNGGQVILSPAKLTFEIQEIVNGVAGMPVTLYDGALANTPSPCSVVAASSLNLRGSLRAVHLTSLGSCWVASTPAGGAAVTRRLGTVAQAAECYVERTGKLVFYSGFVPGEGEQIAVSYRTVGRSVGRQVNAASQQALAGTAAPVASWIGTVTNPAARSSADCRCAAATLAQAASSASALWSGTYRGTNYDFVTDVWPGDALALNAASCNLIAQVVVRSVNLSYRASTPDVMEYAIAFANDWANDLAIHTSTAVPADAWLPAPVAPTAVANLNNMAVTALNGSVVTISPGVTPPSGGGFEVRRRDYAFMPGEDPDLVLRGSQATLALPRLSANDRFYFRMYDGATPPNYSEFSAALFINLPLAS